MTITRDPRMNPQDPPPPLGDEARALLLAYRESREVPELVKARVGRRLAGEGPRRQSLWAAGLLAAAAAIVIAYGVGAGPGLGRGARSGAGTGEAASFTREGEPERAAKARGEGRARAGAGVDAAVDVAVAGDGAAHGEVSPAAAPGEVRGAAIDGDGTGASASGEAVGRGAPEGARSTGAAARGRAAAKDAGEGEAPALDLAGERRLLEEAWRALTLGDEARAIAAARAHRDAYPEGILAQERDAIEVIARCKAGAPAAPAEAGRFAERHPQSPWLPQVHAACPE